MVLRASARYSRAWIQVRISDEIHFHRRCRGRSNLTMKLVELPVHHVVQDPVCGMSVDPATAAGHVDYQGETYYFCNAACLTAFQTNPGRYVSPEQNTAAAAAPSSQVEYTCPMHPEVVRNGP